MDEPIKPEPVKPTFLEHVTSYLGKDVTPTDNIPDSVDCAETLSIILRDYLGDFPIFTYTPALNLHLKNDKRFEQVLEHKPGTIIISPSAFVERVLIHGHCGVFLDDKIASNSSATGIFSKNYTLQEWIKYFRTEGGLHLYFYNLK